MSGFDAEDPSLTPVFDEIERLWKEKDYEEVVELETQMWTDGPGQAAEAGRARCPAQHGRMEPGELGEPSRRADQVQRLDPPAVGRLAEVTIPTLVIWGRLDTSESNAAGEKLAAEIPGARSQVYPDVAHMVSLEKPEDFNRRLADFLTEVDSASD